MDVEETKFPQYSHTEPIVTNPPQKGQAIFSCAIISVKNDSHRLEREGYKKGSGVCFVYLTKRLSTARTEDK